MASAADGSPQLAPSQDVRLLVDNMPMLAWSSHVNGSVDFVNQQWRELYRFVQSLLCVKFSEYEIIA
jgi:PAS domain-containing protein